MDTMYWWTGFLVLWTGGIALAFALIWVLLSTAFAYYCRCYVPLDLLKRVLAAKKTPPQKRINMFCRLGKHSWQFQADSGSDAIKECRECGLLSQIDTADQKPIN